jgi:hypothetical protein
LITDAASTSVRELNMFLYGAFALGGLERAGERVELSDAPETFDFEAFELAEALETLETLDALETFRAAGDKLVEGCLTADIGVWSDGPAVLGRRDR